MAKNQGNGLGSCPFGSRGPLDRNFTWQVIEETLDDAGLGVDCKQLGMPSQFLFGFIWDIITLFGGDIISGLQHF